MSIGEKELVAEGSKMLGGSGVTGRGGDVSAMAIPLGRVPRREKVTGDINSIKM